MATVAEQIKEKQDQLIAVNRAIREILEGTASSYSISGGGASRSKTFLSLTELRELGRQLEADIQRLSPRRTIHVAFGNPKR